MADRSIEHASFTIERHYQSPPDRVFRAWSDPTEKSRWFTGPDSWAGKPYILDFRVGGTEENIEGPPDGPVHTYRARYWDILVNERIVYTYELLIDDVRVSVSLATVELKPEGAGTHLTLTEHGAFFDALEPPTDREHGMGGLLNALSTAVDSPDTDP